MPNILNDLVATDITPYVVAIRLTAAALMGIVVAGIYQVSQRKSLQDSFALVVTLVMMTVLVAMTTLVIGNSVARAFSLVGALSIVRFRTVVDDTRDTAFVIFSVVVGMAVGAGIVEAYLIGVPLIGVVSTAMSFVGHGFPRRKEPDELRLQVRVEGGIDPDSLIANVFQQLVASCRLTSASTAKQGASLDLEYRIRLVDPESGLQLVRQLASLDGVQDVELK